MDIHSKECRQHLGAESGPKLTMGKETGTSVLQPQGTEFNLKELESGFFLKASKQELSLANPLILACKSYSRDPSHVRTDSDPWKL